MPLHVPTIFVALFLSFALFVTTLTFSRRLLGAGVELRLWVRGTWLMLASFVALFSRVVLPEWFSVLVGNGLLFASLYLMDRALHRFVLQREGPRWHLLLMLGGWAVTGLVLDLALAVRTMLVSIMFVVQLLPLVWLLVRHGWHAETSLRTVAVAIALTVVAVLVRVANAALYPQDFAGYFQTSLGNGITYLASYLFPLGAGFGFVLANLERTAHRLDALATHDSMTGCLNRGAFDAMLGHALQRVRREGTPASLIVMDLDNFKQINDAQGHPAGDAVLSACAHALRGRLRAGDVFGRLGGDEFAVLLPDTDMAGAWRLAEDLRSTAEALEVLLPAGGSLSVTLSMGVATAQAEATLSVQALYVEADRSLYAAKHAGRNRAHLGAHLAPVAQTGLAARTRSA